MKYFVWIGTLTGPQAQLWLSKPLDGNGKQSKEVLFEVRIDDCDDVNLTIEQLKAKFPCPVTA